MHSEFKTLREELMQEQERNAKMQQKVFEMMRMVQQVVLDEAERSARVLGSMSSQFGKFHHRCIPEYTRKSFDLGFCCIIYYLYIKIGSWLARLIGVGVRFLPVSHSPIINLGIAAVQHRNERNKIQKDNKITREEAEDLLKEKNLADLDVWEQCVPKPKNKARPESAGPRRDK